MRRRGGWECLIVAALAGGLFAAPRPSAPQVADGFGVPIFPGALSQPAVAQAVAAYYWPALEEGQDLSVGVFETPAAFQAVYDFYGPRMERGKWGWGRKSYPILHQAKTLEFLRVQLVRERGEQGKLPRVFQALLGDPAWTEQDFRSKLDELMRQHPDAKIEIVEGTRRIAGDPTRSEVRVMVERPYLDLERMLLVDRTRIQLIKIWPGARESR